MKITTTIFLEKNSYEDKSSTKYFQIFNISVELTFLKGLMLIRQANPKTAIFATICIF